MSSAFHLTASGRNSGHLNNGLAHSYLTAKAQLGQERATALYHALDASIGTLERLLAEEGIACDFRRAGKLKLASKPRISSRSPAISSQ